jgi:hypothetical protein
VYPATERAAGNYGHGSRSLPNLTGRLTVRADGGHAPPLSGSGKLVKLTFTPRVGTGEMSGVESN